MDEARIEMLTEAVLRALAASGVAPAARASGEPLLAGAQGAVPPNAPPPHLVAPNASMAAPPPASPPAARPGIPAPVDAEGLAALVASTGARIGLGRAGPRPRTADLLRFQADLAVTRDALGRAMDPALLAELGLFAVRTKVGGSGEAGTEEYLRRPDLGRSLSDEAKKTIAERCAKSPDLQLCVGDGLSAQAIEANLRKIYPVIVAGCAAAGLSMGTPFFVERCRVGAMNDIGDIVKPKVLVLLIGERPGLGRADSMSAYMAYRPKKGDTDAERDVVCNIYDGGGTNPLEAGAYVVALAQRMIAAGASGVKLRLGEEA